MKIFLRNFALTAVLFVSALIIASPAEAYVNVKGYYRSNGTYVKPSVRSNPNGLKSDNYGYKPSQGLYNTTYGTRGSSWDTPTTITDPNYYVGKNLYEGLGNSNVISAPIIKTYPAIVPVAPSKIAVPANAYTYGNRWYCDTGYKKVNEGCEKIVAPANAYVYGSYWYCDTGYKKINNNCEEVIAPANSYVYGSNWYCDTGYKKIGNECTQVIAPLNAYIYGSNWYCDSGFRQVNNACERIIVPANAYVYGNNWYCNIGYRKMGSTCVER